MKLYRFFLPAKIPGFVFLLAALGTAPAQLPAKHSRDFILRYECDVAPALAGWTANLGSTGPAPLAANGWMLFTTSAPETLTFGHASWTLTPNSAYTAEISYKTPARGQWTISAGPNGNPREAVTLTPAGLLWRAGGASAQQVQLAAHQANESHTVRFASWRADVFRMVQVWHDGRVVYGPATAGVLSAGPEVITFGETSASADCDVDIGHIRLDLTGAFAPFLPALTVAWGSPSANVTWSTVPGVEYQLQVSANLTSWSDAGPPIPAFSASSSATDATGGQKTRFYRVRETSTGSLDQPFYPGPPPAITNLPALVETVDPTSLTRISPSTGPGYEDYPINGETAFDQYRSYARREVLQAIKHAAARVDSMTAHWPFGNRKPLGLGDMSEANGAIPGTRDGFASHPVGTHTDGKDIDVAYYQLDTPDNRLRPICDSFLAGSDQSHCVGPPTILDSWRTALFLGSLMQHPKLRVIGVDGQAGPLIAAKISQLIDTAWLPETVRPAISKLTWEATDNGLGWYLFHHHNIHISFRQ